MASLSNMQKDNAKTIKTRILILSDTHSDSLTDVGSKNPLPHPLPSADVVLHCGDLTMVGYLEEYTKAIALLSSIDAPLKLVIAGNHDISLDEKYYYRKGPSMHGGGWISGPGFDEALPQKAKAMWIGDESIAARRGIKYLAEGTYELKLQNGAKLRLYASPYQPEFCDWAFPYFRNEDRYNPTDVASPGAKPISENPIPSFPDVDVVMTHGPPLGMQDKTYNGELVGCQHLLRAISRARPKLHCFGHIHEGWGAARVQWNCEGKQELASVGNVVFQGTSKEMEKAVYVDLSSSGEQPLQFGKETLMVNASIMNIRYVPMNAPWLVDIDLPAAE